MSIYGDTGSSRRNGKYVSGEARLVQCMVTASMAKKSKTSSLLRAAKRPKLSVGELRLMTISYHTPIKVRVLEINGSEAVVEPVDQPFLSGRTTVSVNELKPIKRTGIVNYERVGEAAATTDTKQLTPDLGTCD